LEGLGRLLLFYYAPLRPLVLFQTSRHRWFAKALGLLAWNVGAGYRYIANDDVFGVNITTLQHT
jgi:hypothetical protein